MGNCIKNAQSSMVGPSWSFKFCYQNFVSLRTVVQILSWRIFPKYLEAMLLFPYCKTKGPTIIFSPGGYCDFLEAGNFFPPSIERLQVFFLHSGCADNFLLNSSNLV